jgi:zinc transporter 9
VTLGLKVAKWLASVYGGDASDDALQKSTHAVNVAMACNLICFLTKLGAFAYTGSASVFSEALHSLADLANQMLLAMGINRSKRGPSEKHPFGSGNERYVWGLASAVSLFFVGAGASIYHGVSALYHPPHLESLDLALYTLILSAVLEGISIWVAMEAVRQGAKDNGMTFWQYCLNGPDPMGVAVLMEDGAAMAGLVIAGACTGLSYIFGTPVFDAVGSIMIGGLLGVAASFLINKNSSALLGQSMPASKFNLIMETLRNDKVIIDIKAAKGIMIGADVATFSAEVDFDYKVFVESYLSRYPAAELHSKISSPDDVSALLSDFCNHIFTDLGVQINRLEEKIQGLVPEVQFVDIEVN